MDITAQAVAYTYLFPVICTAGISGNLMLLITLKLGSLRESPYIYLATLAVADLMALISVSGICLVRCENCSTLVRSQYISKMYEAFFYLPFSNMAACLVSFTTLMMTIERFIYVRHPMMSLNIITTGKTKFIVAFLALVAVTVNVPRFFLYDVQFKFGPLHPGQFKNVTTPDYLTLNCVPPTRYLVDRQMDCNVSIPRYLFNATFDNDSLSTYLNGENCVLNMAEIINDKDAFKMDSIFHYESQYEDRVSYNMTDAIEIEKLLFNFPCKINVNSTYWNNHAFKLRAALRVVMNWTRFYEGVGDKYFTFLSVLYMLPYLGVAVLNCYIITIVRISATRRRSKLMERTYSFKTTAKLAEQDHLTITLLCLTGIQILANLVYLSSIAPLAKLIYDGDLRDNGAYKIHITASNMCILIQYSSNFLFFAFFNGRFRREFKKVLVLRISNKLKNVTSTLRRKNPDEIPRNSQKQARLSTSTVVSLCTD